MTAASSIVAISRIQNVGSSRCLGGLDHGAGARMKVGALILLLEEDGWRLVRTRGSHRQYKNPNKQGTVTVAGNLILDVPARTLNAILKQAGLRKAGGDG
jgi:predicted RNA binding protein YcfA (HicA-like mRNA interferase family)